MYIYYCSTITTVQISHLISFIFLIFTSIFHMFFLFFLSIYLAFFLSSNISQGVLQISELYPEILKRDSDVVSMEGDQGNEF